MHDRGQFWSPVPDWHAARIQTAAVRVACVRPAAVWQLSGEYGATLTRLGVGAVRGPRDRCADDRYALRLAPDSVLLVSADGVGIGAGWHDEGYAATELGDGLLLFDVEGPGAGALMACGSEYAFDSTAPQPRESARLLFAGHALAVSRRPAGWRLHVPRPGATALWRWLEAHVE